MSELYLKFTNENGEEERILIEGEKFVIGRHSDNDLSIVNSNLSRRHIQIERFADVFMVSDLDSSNGTTLNENDLKDPESLKDGDKLNLGGGLELEIELISDNSYKNNGAGDGLDSDTDEKNNNSGSGTSANTVNSDASVSSQTDGGSGLRIFFIIAPIMGLMLLLILGGAFYFLSDGSVGEVARNNDDFIYTSNEDDDFLKDIPEDLSNDEEQETETIPVSDTTETNNGTNATQTDNPTNSTPTSSITSNIPQSDETAANPAEMGETDKIREPALDFMRRIAYEDPRPVLTTKQLQVINAKIKQYQDSSVLAANIKAAKSNTSQIETLANSKNLKPQLLATAALSKLGNQRGDVFAAAQGMAEVLQNLSVQIGQGLANDSLILVAVYNQGVAGENLKMRNKLASLANQNPSISSRQIRTIWFLRDKGELTDQEFELALRFLAIGTITQNPKAFNVNAEALVF
ncbi:MAG: FHA domain-containing protein [Aridibacter sp.]